MSKETAVAAPVAAGVASSVVNKLGSKGALLVAIAAIGGALGFGYLALQRGFKISGPGGEASTSDRAETHGDSSIASGNAINLSNANVAGDVTLQQGTATNAHRLTAGSVTVRDGRNRPPAEREEPETP